MRSRSRGPSDRSPSAGSSAAPRGGPAKFRAGTACRPCTTPDSRARCAGSRPAYACRNSPGRYTSGTPGFCPRAHAARRALRLRSSAARTGRAAAFRCGGSRPGSRPRSARRATRSRACRAWPAGWRRRGRCGVRRTRRAFRARRARGACGSSGGPGVRASWRSYRDGAAYRRRSVPMLGGRPEAARRPPPVCAAPDGCRPRAFRVGKISRSACRRRPRRSACRSMRRRRA
ncbi:hypothetical protein FEP14_05318 [Burkholderia multivorans]|nr:hypothetical protein [Burkholderia multivorans]